MRASFSWGCNACEQGKYLSYQFMSRELTPCGEQSVAYALATGVSFGGGQKVWCPASDILFATNLMPQLPGNW